MTTTPVLSKSGDVFVLRLGDAENAFNRVWIDAFLAALVEVDSLEGPRSLVLVGEGKFFSNGMDLAYLFSGAEDASAFVGDVYRMFAKVLAAPYPTVAAINGHAFAGGAMLALACDRRLLREDRGFVCINEVAIGLTLADGPWALIRSKLAPQTAHIAVTSAHRFGGTAAVDAGLVDGVAMAEELEAAAVALAASLATTAGPVLARLKATMYADALDLLGRGEMPPQP